MIKTARKKIEGFSNQIEWPIIAKLVREGKASYWPHPAYEAEQLEIDKRLAAELQHTLDAS